MDKGMDGTMHFADWKTDGQETFEFLGRGWNVAQAKRFLTVNPRESHLLEVVDFKGFMIKAQNIYVEKVAKAGLHVPIIVVRVENAWLPIDGWHRIAKAIKENIATLPCVRLSKVEVQKIVYRC